MLKHIKILLERNAYFIAIAFTIIIVFLSLAQLSNVMPDLSIKNIDKFYHAISYFVLTLSWLFAIRKSHENYKFKLIVVFALIAIGIILEILQGGVTTYRHPNFFDAIANTVGIILGTLMFNKILKKYNAL